MASLRDRVTTLRRSPMAGNFLVYSLDFSLKIVVQLGYFIVISRALGVAGYGLFASVAAISMLATTFVGMGAEHVLIRRVARDGTPFSIALGNAITAMAVTLPVLVPLAVLSALWLGLEGLTLTAVLLIVLADLGPAKAINLAMLAFQSQEMARPQFVLNILTSVLKLAAALGAYLLVEDLTLELWGWWYAGSLTVAGAFSLLYLFIKLGRPKFAFYPRDMGDGFIYSLEFASMAALRDLDKPVVADTLGPAAAGSYTAAFRLVDTSCVPIRALLRTTYVRYFHAGGESLEAALTLAKRVLPIMVGMAVVLGAGLLVGASFVPWLLGAEYEPAVSIIRWMAAYPLILGLSSMGADMLRGLNLQRERLVVMVLTTVTYVPMIWAGTQIYGAEGAAIARILSQSFLLVATGFIIWRVARRLRAGTQGSPRPSPAE